MAVSSKLADDSLISFLVYPSSKFSPNSAGSAVKGWEDIKLLQAFVDAIKEAKKLVQKKVF